MIASQFIVLMFVFFSLVFPPKLSRSSLFPPSSSPPLPPIPFSFTLCGSFNLSKLLFHRYPHQSFGPLLSQMGKFMRKPKITGEVSIMEVLPSPSYSPLGVCTRSRTLALQRSLLVANDGSNATSYLQLRSRTLEKLPSPCSGGNAVVGNQKEANLRDGNGAGSNSGNNRARRSVVMAEEMEDVEKVEETEVASWDPSVEQEGGGEVDSSERKIRETTPCSLILDSELLETPGSTTRKSYSNASCVRRKNTACRNIPTSHEMEELFSGAERIQQQKFTERYNFDLVNDCPLPGRYEWMALDC